MKRLLVLTAIALFTIAAVGCSSSRTSWWNRGCWWNRGAPCETYDPCEPGTVYGGTYGGTVLPSPTTTILPGPETLPAN